MTAHRVTFIPGDGTGPELAEATKRVLEATGVEFEWDFQDAGVDVYESEGNPLPDRTLDSIRERGIAIKGPTTTPVGSGHRSINVALRKEFDLYACIRPCKAYDGVRTRFVASASSGPVPSPGMNVTLCAVIRAALLAAALRRAR